MDRDENFTDIIEEAQDLVEKKRFEEGLQSAANELMIASSADEIFRARIVLIQAQFGLNHFDEVCAIVDDMTGHPLPQSLEHIALMIGLSCLGAVHKYQRKRTIKILTNSADSVCRLCFDSETGFSDLRNVGMEISDCNYGSAVEKMKALNAELIVSNLTMSLIVEYVTSYATVGIDKIAREFGFTEDDVLEKLETLIKNHPGLTEYRIDARRGEVHKRFRTNEERLNHLNWETQRQSKEIVDEISLFNWRLITATGRWVVGKDVSP